MSSDLDTPAELVPATDAAAPLVLTCEHASERFPPPFRWPDGDAWLGGTHWAFDPGAADLTRELARHLGAAAVLSRFSRLLADPNRPEDSPELFRTVAEGRTIALNARIDGAERARRLALHRGFHAAADRAIGEVRAGIVFAVHTFTPVYEGTPRRLEAGVLFDEETALAERLEGALRRAGFQVELNEPYSGKAGLMYSVDRHARAHGRRALELELRQDLAVQPAVRARIVTAVAAFARDAGR